MNCLEHVQHIWPRDGILRVEIVRNAPENYTIINSYKKEYSDIQLFFQNSIVEELGLEVEVDNNDSPPSTVNAPVDGAPPVDTSGSDAQITANDAINHETGSLPVGNSDPSEKKGDSPTADGGKDSVAAWDTLKGDDGSQNKVEDQMVFEAEDEDKTSEGLDDGDKESGSSSLLKPEEASNTWSSFFGYVISVSSKVQK